MKLNLTSSMAQRAAADNRENVVNNKTMVNCELDRVSIIR